MLELWWVLVVIALTVGNASGLGNTRSDELYESYAKLGVPESRVQLINDP